MKMKKILIPVALFTAFCLTSCDEDLLNSECEKVDDSESCSSISKASLCCDEETGKCYYSYLGNRYDDRDDLIDALCPNASNMDKLKIRAQLSAQGKNLIARIRANAL